MKSNSVIVMKGGDTHTYTHYGALDVASLGIRINID